MGLVGTAEEQLGAGFFNRSTDEESLIISSACVVEVIHVPTGSCKPVWIL